MHVLLLLDEPRLRNDLPVLNRMIVGLLAEGVRVTRGLPEGVVDPGLARELGRLALLRRIELPAALPWPLHRVRRDRVLASIARDPPAIVHALGHEGADLACELGLALDACVAIGVHGPQQLDRLPLAPRLAAAVDAYVAEGRALARALSERVEEDLVALAPLGVAIPDEPLGVLRDGAEVGLFALTDGDDVAGIDGMLEGFARVARDRPDLRLFMELRGRGERHAWETAGRLGLHDRLSTFRDASALRDLVLRCDVILLPEREAPLRSLALEAMARGIPVIAARNPWLDPLRDGETGVVVPHADGPSWAQALAQLLGDPAAARRLGLAGREIVSREHRGAEQAALLAEIYARIVHGDAYRLVD